MSTVIDSSRASSCVHSIGTDLHRNEVRVVFNNRRHYLYRNVSTAAIKQLLGSQDISLGSWVHKNCISPDDVKCIKLTKSC